MELAPTVASGTIVRLAGGTYRKGQQDPEVGHRGPYARLIFPYKLEFLFAIK